MAVEKISRPVSMKELLPDSGIELAFTFERIEQMVDKKFSFICSIVLLYENS